MAGTITQTSREFREFGFSKSKRCEVVTVDWVADAADGSVPDLSVVLRGWVVKIITNPGSTAPTANYDIVVTDPETSLDAVAGALANRHTTNTEQVYPAVAGSPGTVTAFRVFLNGTYTISISNNAVNSATGRIQFYLVDEI